MSVRKKFKRVRAESSIKSIQLWFRAIGRVPNLAGLAVRSSARAISTDALKTLKKEGTSELHWKILGDGLVNFFRQSGPLLTKLGQILATRNDLLPPTVCRKLESLYNKQPPMKKSDLDKILFNNYRGKKPFKSFEYQALGVGSVGEVHRATLVTGENVIVKLIRPGSKESIERDALVSRALINGLFFTLGVKYKTTHLMIDKILSDLEMGFLSELNLKLEGAALNTFRSQLKKNSSVYVPKCYTELSSASVLVMEELNGIPLSQYREQIKSDPKKAKKIADLALREILTQIFDAGFFHADPHAGNIIVLEDGRLGFIDFGLTGEFTKKNRKAIGKAVKALLSKDVDSLISSLLEFGTVPKTFKLAAFKQDIAKIVRSHKESDSKKLDALVNQLFVVAFKHQIYVPASTTLLIKTLVTIEGVARSIDPDLNLMSVAVPVVLHSLTPKWLRFGSFFSRKKEL